MFNRQLSSFLPTIYKDIVEMDDIINSEEQIMDIARREMSSAFANTFILTSDESGVIMFEKILNITADVQTETLEFRKGRVLNRLAMSPPFTFNFLKSKLNDIIGPGLWAAYIDFNRSILYVESSSSNQHWYHEVEFTINRIKPCAMVFINVPLTPATMQLSEEIDYTELRWRYRLGSWKLGEYSFATPDGGGVAKVAEVKSIQQALLNDTANFVAEDISAVLLNDTIKISEFTLKQVSENIVIVEYLVTSAMTNLITNIKLLRSDETVLTQSVVYVPVTQTITSKHTITVKEGA